MNQTEQITEAWIEDFHGTETMRTVLKQCVYFSVLSGVNIEKILLTMREDGELPARDKKQGIKRLEELRNRLLSRKFVVGTPSIRKRESGKPDILYIEKDIRNHVLTKKIREKYSGTEVKYIDHYKDIFYHPSPDKNGLILAKNRNPKLLPGAPVCHDFEEEYFYYTSLATGCLYDCEYCYLKGMYPSGDQIVYVNIEDTFSETEKVLKEHEAYVCISYDSDLMSLESFTGYVEQWNEFVREHDGLRVECRTKCARTDLWKKMTPCDRMIFAFTLSPQEVIRRYEHRTPSLGERLACIREGMEAGFTVRLCFDPVIAFPGWEEEYDRLIRDVTDSLDPDGIRDVSVGSFRIPQDYLRQLRRREPDSAVVQYPFVNEDGVCRYPEELHLQMCEKVVQGLKRFVPEDRIYLLADRKNQGKDKRGKNT